MHCTAHFHLVIWRSDNKPNELNWNLSEIFKAKQNREKEMIGLRSHDFLTIVWVCDFAVHVFVYALSDTNRNKLFYNMYCLLCCCWLIIGLRQVESTIFIYLSIINNIRVIIIVIRIKQCNNNCNMLQF